MGAEANISQQQACRVSIEAGTWERQRVVASRSLFQQRLLLTDDKHKIIVKMQRFCIVIVFFKFQDALPDLLIGEHG